MRKSLPILLAICISTTGLMLGCQSNSRPAPEDHDALFGVGTGEFGESTRIAGDYDYDFHHADQGVADAR